MNRTYLLLFSELLLASVHPVQAQLPTVPKGFEIRLVAKEPLVRNPCSLTFDARGRLFIGMGPQYRNPTPQTRGDSVVILSDKNGDGVFDSRKTFATGFNCIQGLAWHGRDLWIANAPDLTVVRDTDGDDVADKYTLVYTDLGNLEHGLHGLNWGPDGRMYMSKGNSKGYTRPGRLAPKPFRDLWGVQAPAGSPDFPRPKTFTPQSYRHAFHHPADDWGREGGVLVCDDMGKNLEIVCRGFRNPWDIAFDNEFNFQGTDNDQNEGDRVFMSYFGAHYGWGHPWSAHWTGQDHLPTAPITGPVFHGSGTGMIFYDEGQFPAAFAGVWFFNDWLRRTTYMYRPTWQGALIQPQGGKWVEFVNGSKLLFKPTDLDVGPDGSLYILGWGNSYGATYDKAGNQTNEGRIWRVRWKGDHSPRRRSARPLQEWSVAQLLADFRGPLPIWRSNSQDELVRRGATVVEPVVQALKGGRLTTAQETWAIWTLARLPNQVRQADRTLVRLLTATKVNRKVQALRGLAFRARRGSRSLPSEALRSLHDKNARVRVAAVLALRRARARGNVRELVQLLATESDRVVYYAGWQTLRTLSDVAARRRLLRHKVARVQQAAVLSLAEEYALTRQHVRPLLQSTDADTRSLVGFWLAKESGNPLLDVHPRGREFVGRIFVNITPGLKPADVHYTIDGTTPTARSPRWPGRLLINKTTTLKVAIFINERPVGRVAELKYIARKVDRRSVGSGCYDINSKSGNIYQIAAGLQPGNLAYSDRPYVYRQVPTQLRGSYYIQTSNNDAESRGGKFLTMHTAVGVRVFLAYDTRAKIVPAWIRKGGFKVTKLVIRTNDATFRVYQRDFAPGPIVLGGNDAANKAGGKSNYLLVLQPQPFAKLKVSTSLASVLQRLPRGNRDRGQALFLSDAVGCAKCHRLDGKKSFGPDLAHLVKSPDAKHLVTSILKPSAQIKEGFTTQLVVTEAGKIFRGVLTKESGQSITLLQTDLKSVTIRKNDIARRSSQPISPMPAFDRMLSPQQIADMAAWLLHRRKPDKK